MHFGVAPTPIGNDVGPINLKPGRPTNAIQDLDKVSHFPLLCMYHEIGIICVLTYKYVAHC
jgi:hypothetical protein